MANLTLGIKKADRFVKQQNELGNDVRWNGWDMIFFRPSEAGIYSKHGAFRNGVWGFDNVVPVSDDGQWHIDFRNVKRVKGNRQTRNNS